MTSVYVAGKYAEWLTIREHMEKFRTAGFKISYDWTQNAMKVHCGGAKDYAGDAKADLDGVMNAEWTVLIMDDPDYEYRGTFCELGASISRDIQRGKKRTIIVTRGLMKAEDCCFFHHPNVLHVCSTGEAINLMLGKHLYEHMDLSL
jgi:hypothetical protein